MCNVIKYIIRFYCQLRNVITDYYLFGKNLRNNKLSTGKYNAPHSSDYSVLEEIFSVVSIKPNQILLDVGSGHGRAVLWLKYRFPQSEFIGCELDDIIYERSYKICKSRSINVINKDILDLRVDVDFIFLFNPLGRNVLIEFIKRIKACQYGASPTVIFFSHTLYDVIFESNPAYFQLYHCKKYLNRARSAKFAVFKY